MDVYACVHIVCEHEGDGDRGHDDKMGSKGNVVTTLLQGNGTDRT